MELLKNLEYNIENLRSKSWDEFTGEDVPPIKLVITVCESAGEENSPICPGSGLVLTMVLTILQPKKVSKSIKMQAFQKVFFQLYRQIDLLLNLPIDFLEDQVLKEKPDEIRISS